MITNEQINLQEIQNYIENLTGTINVNRQSFDRRESKSPLFAKMRKDKDVVQEPVMPFNPSKTFGGEKTRIMFPIK
jgi:hypothetical protein